MAEIHLLSASRELFDNQPDEPNLLNVGRIAFRTDGRLASHMIHEGSRKTICALLLREDNFPISRRYCAKKNVPLITIASDTPQVIGEEIDNHTQSQRDGLFVYLGKEDAIVEVSRYLQTKGHDVSGYCLSDL